jgi:hypothetical protein
VILIIIKTGKAYQEESTEAVTISNWTSKKQEAIPLSSTDAEKYALIEESV